MASSPHPANLLLRLLQARPVARAFDRYPPHWRTLLRRLAAVPAHPHLRQQALAHLIAGLTAAELDRIQEDLEDPYSLMAYTALSPRQRQLMDAVSAFGPATASEVAFHLGRDLSNVRKLLLMLVSLGQLQRFRQAGRILYRLPG